MVRLDILQCCEREEREREKEAEDMAAPECEREARKRRERRDSGCAHERKERRPHSEERPQAPLPPPPLQDYNRLESERRAERLSRARRPQFGVKRRRPPVRIQKQPKENEHSITIEEFRCSTPPHFEYAVVQKPQISDEPQTLDAATLHRRPEASSRPGSAEPTSEDSTIEYNAAERARRDERHAAPPNTRREQPSPDRRLEKLNKKIIVLKKSIGKHEAEFEAQNGYAITPNERITDVKLTQMYETLRRLQAEKRCIKADPVEYSLKLQASKQQKERDERLEIALKSEKSMVDIVRDIEEWLEGCRQAGGRASVPESNWNSAQLAAEKSCVQKALLRMEAARGRPPAHSADRGAARHLYERYRTVKRVLASTRPDAVMGNGELATIHEHEAMLFNSVDSSSDSQEKPTDSSQDTIETPLQSPPTRDVPPPITEEVASSTSSAKSAASEEVATSNEALHCLSIEDLSKALIEAKVLKGNLRRSIKDYENSFEMLNSRKVQRDDKKGREDDYIRYKTVKARIKLITALINKQKTL